MIERRATLAVKAAAAVAAILGLLTTLVAVIAGFGIWDPTGGAASGWNVIDGALYLGLAYGIYRGSRAAAVAMLVLHLLSRVLVQFMGAVPDGSLYFGLVVAVVLAAGVWGTFVLHKRRAEQPDADPSMDSLADEARLP